MLLKACNDHLVNLLGADMKSKSVSDVKIATVPQGQCAEDLITAEGLACLAANASTTNGMVTAFYASRTMGVNICLQEMALELNRQVMAAERGDRTKAESLLQCQAITLNAIFAEMARRAALNMNSNIPATEAYMRMALRAQNQSRATLETLSAIKNPSLVVAKQANITTGPQQVNNVLVNSSMEGSQNLPTQLSGEMHELRQNP